MIKIIAIANQKGGVGKTATAAALAQGLERFHGKKALAVDLDAQCNLSQLYGVKNYKRTTETVMARKLPAYKCDQSTPRCGRIIAASPNLATMDARLSRRRDKYREDVTTILRDALREFDQIFQYIIIDCPPSVGVLTVNALVAADCVIIPIASGDPYSISGALAMRDNIDTVRSGPNPGLKIAGLLITKVRRTSLAATFRARADSLAEQLDTRVFAATIRQAVAVQEAATVKRSIFAYAPRSAVAQDYKEFINEVRCYD